MGLDQTDTVDFLGLEKETGVLVATIVDEYDWNDEVHHLQLLQSKINRYFDFIESGEIYREFRKIKDQEIPPRNPVRISIMAKFPVEGQGKLFMEHVKGIAEEIGIGFSFKVMD